MKQGLNLEKSYKESKDKRNYSFSKVFGAVEELPDKDFMVGEPLLIKDQKDTDFCFPANTPILTEDLSYKPIQDITVGDYIYTHQQNLKRVIKTHKRIWQGKMVKIKFKGDYRIIQSTPKHPFFVMRDGDKCFVPAKN